MEVNLSFTMPRLFHMEPESTLLPAVKGTTASLKEAATVQRVGQVVITSSLAGWLHKDGFRTAR
jgi:hypothetical protein